MENEPSKNYYKELEEMVDRFVESLKCRCQEPVPEIKVEGKNSYYANLLYNAYAGQQASEMTAVAQYLYHHTTIKDEETANALLCISIVEMSHFHILAELIGMLSSQPFYVNSNHKFWDAGSVSYGDKPDCDSYESLSEKENIRLKLQEDILDETAAINTYTFLISEIDDKYIRESLARIIKDEKEHIKIFSKLIRKYE